MDRSNLPMSMKIEGPVFPLTGTGIQGAFAVAHSIGLILSVWGGKGGCSRLHISFSPQCFHICNTEVLNIHCKSIKLAIAIPKENKNNKINQQNKPKQQQKREKIRKKQFPPPTHPQASLKKASQKTGFNFEETSLWKERFLMIY